MPLYRLCSLVSVFLILRMPHSVHYPIPDTPTHPFFRAGSILGQNRCRSPHALSSLRCATLVETPYRQPQHCLVISPVLSAADSSYHLMVPFLSFCSLAGGWCPLHVATVPPLGCLLAPGETAPLPHTAYTEDCPCQYKHQPLMEGDHGFM